ncbi:MAG: hypothetical protein L0H84_14425, partial [Pseudonocardia sp.]|nr:hypothetical protein [Pseudonocardia sp.]
MDRIPRGVVDGARLAAVHDRSGVVVALDPITGQVRWRAGRGLRPCAIVAGTIVAVRPVQPPALEVVVLAEDDGRELWTAPAIDLPDWARPALDDTPAFELTASAGDDGIVLRWAARAGYEGGAAPSPERLAAARREAAGVMRVDLANRDVEPLPGALVANEPPDAPAPPAPALGADVVDHTSVREVRVELAVSRVDAPQHHGAAGV